MKKSSLVLLLAALFFGAVTYYFMYYADGGADGLGSYMFIILFGVLTACLLVAFLLSFLIRKGQSKTIRNLIIGAVIVLPILGILSVAGVFSYFTYDYEKQWEDQIESDSSVLTTLQFEDKNFGVAFKHVSGKVSVYENGKPIPTPMTPKIVDGKLIVPADDETYMEPDVLIKLENKEQLTLFKYLEELNSELNLDVKFKNGDLDDFPNLSKDTKILMLGEETPYKQREKIGKQLASEKMGQPDLIYFINSQSNLENIWILIVSSKISSAPAFVEKMSVDNFENGNLWFHTIEFIK